MSDDLEQRDIRFSNWRGGKFEDAEAIDPFPQSWIAFSKVLCRVHRQMESNPNSYIAGALLGINALIP